MAKHRLGEMSWREVRVALAAQPVVLMPLGSTEQHGPVSPTGDYMITDAIALRSGAFRPPALLKKLYGDDVARVLGHGDEPLASMWLHLRPELVDLKANEPGGRADFYGLTINDLSVATFDRTPVAVYFDMEEISPNGSMGDSTVASADKGRAIFEAVVDGCVAFVERFTQMNVRPPGGPGTLSD